MSCALFYEGWYLFTGRFTKGGYTSSQKVKRIDGNTGVERINDTTFIIRGHSHTAEQFAKNAQKYVDTL